MSLFAELSPGRALHSRKKRRPEASRILESGESEAGFLAGVDLLLSACLEEELFEDVEEEEPED